MRWRMCTKLAPTLPKDNLLVMNLCGRGDKDVSQSPRGWA